MPLLLPSPPPPPPLPAVARPCEEEALGRRTMPKGGRTFDVPRAPGTVDGRVWPPSLKEVAAAGEAVGGDATPSTPVVASSPEVSPSSRACRRVSIPVALSVTKPPIICCAVKAVRDDAVNAHNKLRGEMSEKQHSLTSKERKNDKTSTPR